MKSLLIFTILLSCFSQALATDKVRAEILLSINDNRKSIYINRIYDEALIISSLKNIPQSVLIARACIDTNFGRNSSGCDFIELRSLADDICSNGTFIQTKREKIFIKRFKLYLLNKLA